MNVETNNGSDLTLGAIGDRLSDTVNRLDYIIDKSSNISNLFQHHQQAVGAPAYALAAETKQESFIGYYPEFDKKFQTIANRLNVLENIVSDIFGFVSGSEIKPSINKI